MSYLANPEHQPVGHALVPEQADFQPPHEPGVGGVALCHDTFHHGLLRPEGPGHDHLQAVLHPPHEPGLGGGALYNGTAHPGLLLPGGPRPSHHQAVPLHQPTRGVGGVQALLLACFLHSR